jgi:hypothetical protein
MRLKKLLEMTYNGNIGFEEMVLFYQRADAHTIKKMENVAKREDWPAFKKLIQDTIGKELK